MSAAPAVSVVMSVYNGAEHLDATVASVLGQQDCDFEFVIVDDGSTDASSEVLAALAARDPRVRVLRQENSGLTRALARACAEARGGLIARQDAGDLSLPGRLSMQAAFMAAHPEAVMTGCGVRFVGPQREPLYELERPDGQLDEGLRQSTLEHLRGPPHHGGTMFRREAYASAGGYRMPFVVAQDIDLWLRLCEAGKCLGTKGSHYEARLEAGSISGRRRKEQFRMGRLALACAAARKRGDEPQVLAAATPPGIRPGARASRVERARFNYFIASCLRDRDPAGSRRYLAMALRDNPFHIRALMRRIAG